MDPFFRTKKSFVSLFFRFSLYVWLTIMIINNYNFRSFTLINLNSF